MKQVNIDNSFMSPTKDSSDTMTHPFLFESGSCTAEKMYTTISKEVQAFYKEVQAFYEIIADISSCSKTDSIICEYLDMAFQFGDYKVSYPFPPDKQQQITNRIYASCLEVWLEHDRNYFQKVSTFAARVHTANKLGKTDAATKELYLSKREEKAARTITICPKAISRNYERAAKLYRNMQAYHKIYANKEKLGIAPAYRENGARKEYGIPALCAIRLLAEKELSPLVDLALKRKAPMQISGASRTYDALAAAYNAFDRMLNKYKNTSSSREYVAFCMAFRALEESFHFYLVAALSKYRAEHQIPVSENLKLLSQEFWFPYLIEVDETRTTLQPCDITDYKSQIKAHHEANFSPKEIKLQTDYAIEAKRERDAFFFLQRYIFSKIFSIDKIDNLPSWTKEDFLFAKSFYKNTYKFLESFESLNLSSPKGKHGSCFAHIAHIYQQIMDHPVAEEYALFIRQGATATKVKPAH